MQTFWNKHIHIRPIGHITTAFSSNKQFFPKLFIFSKRVTLCPFCAAAMAAIMPAAPPPTTITLLILILFCRHIDVIFLASQRIIQHRFIIYKINLVIQIHLIIVPGLFQCLQILTHLLRALQANATTSALITLRGATRESTTDTMSLLASRLQEEYRFMGNGYCR